MGCSVFIKPSTDQLHNVAVQGPASRDILKRHRLDSAEPALHGELKWFRLLIGRIGDYDGIPIVVSRTGYTGELGYELWCHPDDGPRSGTRLGGGRVRHGLNRLGSRRSTCCGSRLA